MRVLMATCVYGALLAMITHEVNKQVSQPYMDEPFHFNQTKQYCEYRFDQWDKKITTLPGLYVATFIIHVTYQFIVNAISQCLHYSGMPNLMTQSIMQHIMFDSCSLEAMRYYNILYAAVSFVMMYQLICTRLRLAQLSIGQSESLPALLATIRLSLLPISVFFVSLYYTDSLSTMCILAVIYTTQWNDSVVRPLRSRQFLKLFICLFAVFVRQTNVIWIAFALALQLADLYDHSTCDYSLFQSINKFVRHCLASLDVVVSISWPYLVSLFAFVIFVIVNGSIVVGDKSNHSMTVHLVFPLYLAALTVKTSAVSIFFRSRSLYSKSDIAAYLAQWKRSPLTNIGLFALLVFVVHSFTLSHPFLLADNRHVTFYLWRYLLSRWVKFVMVPGYHFALWWMNHSLSLTVKPIVRLTYFLCVALALVPTPLIEPRYCIAPLIIFHIFTADYYLKYTFRLQSPAWLLETIAFVVVHVAVMWLFMYRPYVWGDGSTARFMW